MQYDYTEHGNLSTYLHNPAVEMTPSNAMKIAFDTIKALAYLHDLKPPMVHGNLKSRNILLSADGKIKLSDYGFMSSVFQSRNVFTNCLFDAEWLAPEILAGEPIEDAKMLDVYAFGILLFEIVTRQYPYETMNSMAIGMQVLVEGRRPTIPAYVPPTLCQIMEQCWTHDAADRPPTKAVLNMLMSIRL
eukprot:jgi/Hompol1/1975/HPOL_005035-RA